MKRLLHPIVFFLAALTLTHLIAPSALAADRLYTVGAILPLTGDNASLGNFTKNSLELALEDLRARGQQNVRVVYEDDQLQAARAVAAYRKLRVADNVDAVIVLGSGDGNAVAPLAEQDGVVLVSIGASDINVVRGRRYAFIHWIAPEKEAEVLTEEILRRGGGKVALVTTDQQGCIAARDALRDSFAKRKLSDQIVLDELTAPGERDFRTILGKVKSKGANLVISTLLEGSLSSLAKQIKQQRLKGEITGFEVFEDENEVKASEGALLGAWYVNVDNPSQDFLVRYKTAYAGALPGWGAANAYDTLMILSAGVTKYGRDNAPISFPFLPSPSRYPASSIARSTLFESRDVPVSPFQESICSILQSPSR